MSFAFWLLLYYTLMLSSTFIDAYNAIVVGGSSGMGKAAAREILLQAGGTVLLVSRNRTKLEHAQADLLNDTDDPSNVRIHVLDASREEMVKEFASDLEDHLWDGLVISSAGKAPHGPMKELETEKAKEMMDSKLWTAYHCAKYIAPKLKQNGAVVFVAGILNRRPGLNCCPLAMANGALEGLTRTLALEWGPYLRVNCLSPGFCETERFDHMDPERKQQMMASTAASLPLQKVGQPHDMGRAIFYLLTASFCTGVILDVDGGHGIRQYASPVNDPMRRRG